MGRVRGVPLPVGAEVKFSEYSVIIAAQVQCFIQTPKNWENEDCMWEAAV